jgi:hypothetical protein
VKLEKGNWRERKMIKTFKSYYGESWSFDGMSAKCVYGVYTSNFQGNSYPCDPDDLTRVFQCLRLITHSEDLSAWFNVIKIVSDRYPDSKEWLWIKNNFGELYHSYFGEYDSGTMPKTYALMQGMNV